MDYSTFNKNNFFIKKDSSYPELKYPLIQQVLEKYDITEDMLDNVAITFSMIDTETGRYRIANVAASLVISENRAENPDEEKYTLVYKFRLKDTKIIGRYQGEFKLDFLSNDGCDLKITIPNNNYINIIISDSLTKTSII
jgi:hypothetical protein